MRILPWIRLGWFWLASRYAAPNRYVRCATCPHWLPHSLVDERLPVAQYREGAYVGAAPLSLRYIAGLCLKDRPHIFNDFTTGYALRVWTGEDWCPRHPLYAGEILQGSDLVYAPGEKSTEAASGFDRLPTFAEAVKMAMRDDNVPGNAAVNGSGNAPVNDKQP